MERKMCFSKKLFDCYYPLDIEDNNAWTKRCDGKRVYKRIQSTYGLTFKDYVCNADGTYYLVSKQWCVSHKKRTKALEKYYRKNSVTRG